jgi:hypothetical protein
MAQFMPRSRRFEHEWRPRLHLAAKLLRDYEDVWLRSDRPFPIPETVAVVLNVFTFDFYAADFLGYRGVRAAKLWNRSIEEWSSSVGSPEFLSARLWPHRAEPDRQELLDSLSEQVSRAVESWEQNGPGQPTCEEVVQSMLERLVAGRFVNIKYG